jgi:hypothetical protein
MNYKDIVQELDNIISTKIVDSTLVVFGKINNENVVKKYKYNHKAVAKEVQKRVNYFICNLKRRG